MSISKAELMVLDEEGTEDGGLIKTTKVETNPFTISVSAVETDESPAEETKEEGVANFAVDVVQEILPMPNTTNDEA